MKFISLPVIYTKLNKPPSDAKEESYRAQLKELNIPVDEDVQRIEVPGMMHIDTDSLVNVVITPCIDSKGHILKRRCYMDYGSLDDDVRIFLEVQLSEQELIQLLSDV